MHPVGRAGPRYRFWEKTIDHLNAQGKVEHLPVYVREHFRPVEGVAYALEAGMDSGGVPAQAQATALLTPTVAVTHNSLSRKSSWPVTIDVNFRSLRGAFALHLYVEYYALLGGGWHLGREEVAARSYTDAADQTVLEYPQFTPVTSVANANVSQAEITFDSTEYHAAFTRASRKSPGNVVFVDAMIVLTQVDETLYSYYVVNNITVGDQSTVRVDVPEFTNIDGGWGVFGSSVTVTQYTSLLGDVLPGSSSAARLPRQVLDRLHARANQGTAPVVDRPDAIVNVPRGNP